MDHRQFGFPAQDFQTELRDVHLSGPGFFDQPLAHQTWSQVNSRLQALVQRMCITILCVAAALLLACGGDNDESGIRGNVTHSDPETISPEKTPTSNPTEVKEDIPFDVGVENNYKNFDLIVEKQGMEDHSVTYKLFSGLDVSRDVRGVSNWEANSVEAQQVLDEMALNFQYERWLKINNIQEESVSYEAFKSAKESGIKDLNGVLLPTKKVAFALLAEPPAADVRTELTGDHAYGLISTSKRDIITFWVSYAGQETIDPKHSNASEEALFFAGALYAQNLLGSKTFIKANADSFNENIELQYKVGNKVIGDFRDNIPGLATFR